MKLNKKYSYASHKRKTFLDVPASEFNNSEIIGASFYQNEPYTDVFPADVVGLELSGNYDNCNIPAGATFKSGTNQQIKTQNDGEYWIVDKDLKPISPRDSDNFDRCGLSKVPKDIPSKMVDEPVTIANDPEIIEQRKIEELRNDYPALKQMITSKIVPVEVTR